MTALRPSHDPRRRVSACGSARLVVHAAAAAAAVIFNVVVLGAAAGRAAPYLPADDAQVLERLPTAGNQGLRELRRLHADLARNPEDLALAIAVATRDIEAARAESDPRFNGYAEAALGPWLALPNPPTAVVLLRATLRQATHDFAGALQDLDRVLASEPRNAQARLTRATVLQVKGEYAEALRNCGVLARLAPNLVTLTCIAGVNGLNGHRDASRKSLQDALDRAGSEEAPALRLWALTILAEMDARAGDDAAAEAHFRAALALGVRDGYLLGAYADFLLDAGRPQEVLTLLAGEQRIDPLLLRLALAEQMLGLPALSQHVADLGERLRMNRLRGDTSHQREEARFTLHLLKEVPEAVRIAAANWSVQREPADARLVLEAAVAARDAASAQPVLEWLGTAHLEDGRLQGLADRLREGRP